MFTIAIIVAVLLMSALLVIVKRNKNKNGDKDELNRLTEYLEKIKKEPKDKKVTVCRCQIGFHIEDKWLEFNSGKKFFFKHEKTFSKAKEKIKNNTRCNIVKEMVL